jgi:hypothetical protein
MFNFTGLRYFAEAGLLSAGLFVPAAAGFLFPFLDITLPPIS